MALRCGIVGLPNVGKSTLFNAITQAGAESANYPFCTIDPNVGVVTVPDERLDYLTDLYEPKKTIPTAFEFVDIAGLVEGASKGEGLGNKFLSHIREVDAIAHVVRCFDDENITHVSETVDPKRDIEIINLELALADLESMDKRMAKLESKIKSKDKEALIEYKLVKRIKEEALDEGLAVRNLEFSDDDLKLIKSFNLLTIKPIIYIANISEEEAADPTSNPYLEQVREIASNEDARVIPVSARLESEIAELDASDKKAFLLELGIPQSGLDATIKAAYDLLGLITYLTAGKPEVRAWTITRGMKAPQAAGVIHTDFERGFIKAEVMSFDDLKEAGSEAKVKEQGKLRIEGKEYVVKDGDIMHFRFNV
ncbi:redox-regulated ATPase YchF [Clostridia bacterium]|nr:redox-regulated ATPase YchF [Clostridia bacterium]